MVCRPYGGEIRIHNMTLFYLLLIAIVIIAGNITAKKIRRDRWQRVYDEKSYIMNGREYMYKEEKD